MENLRPALFRSHKVLRVHPGRGPGARERPAPPPQLQRPPGGGPEPAGRAGGGVARSPSAAQRPLTLHVFRQMPLFPMRSSQSKGFRLHFGQHDKAAAGGERGSASARKPRTWTPAAQIQLRRKGGRGDPAAGSPAGSQERASASSGAARPDPRAPSSLAAPEPPPAAGRGRGLRDAAERSGDGVRAPRVGSARAAAARAQLPGAEGVRPSSGRAAEAAWSCRRSRTAGRLLPLRPPALWLGFGRGLSLSLCRLTSPLRPFACLRFPLAHCHKSAVVKFQPPLLLSRGPEQPFPAPRAAAPGGRGEDDEKGGK